MAVHKKKRKYAPGEISIKAGETIKIINDDIFLHHAYFDSDDLEFDSGSMEECNSANIIFTKAGFYQVKCAIHPKMNLDVTVY